MALAGTTMQYNGSGLMPYLDRRSEGDELEPWGVNEGLWRVTGNVGGGTLRTSSLDEGF
jgi:hypothetical protein